VLSGCIAAGLLLVSTGTASAQKPAPTADKKPSTPSADPSLAGYGIYQSTAPEGARVQPIVTTLPLELKKGERIALVGNTLLERAQDYGWLEAFLHTALPKHELVVRHLAWSADEVDLQPRPENFATIPQHLAHENADVVIAAFGFNESFGGLEKIDAFKLRLAKWLGSIKGHAFNGHTAPRIVLLSPPANEDITGVPAARMNNARLEAYTAAMAEVAASEKVGFVDLFHPSLPLLSNPSTQLTVNGVHLTEEGDAMVAAEIFRGLFERTAPKPAEELRRAVVDKNTQYFRRYRPLNTFYYTGGRNKEYGYLDFLPAMRNFDLMTANRDRRIWAIAGGKTFANQPVDDSNLPPLDTVAEGRGANEWLKPADEMAAFKIDPRFDVNLFASEEQFPEIANPIQMRWDARGRLWISCSTTYPHVYPGNEPNDKILILEDTDHDGRADRCTVWADKLHIPLSFELTRNGVYVSEQPGLTLLEDTDGDGRADRRTKLLSGFGTEDSHHALHDFTWTPDGDLLIRESIFHHSQVETAYGPVRLDNSGWFRFTPATQRLVAFGNYPSTNPWGVTFDDWGNHVASHPIFANAFHATNPPYPTQHPAAGKLPGYSGTCGQMFVDFPGWPEEMQGGFLKARYKPTNRIEIHRWIQKADHFEEEYVSDLLFSQNLSFIPVDVGFGPRGDFYVCDWYNPVKGHAQYSLRDPRRSRTSGRIWRIVPKGFKPAEPPQIADAPVPGLLDNLRRTESRYRYWSRNALRERGTQEVAKPLAQWIAGLDQKDPRFRHHQVEALWLMRGLGETQPALLAELAGCDVPQARAAAVRMLRHWYAACPDAGVPLLKSAANDPDGLVRLEAAITASYMGGAAALDAILPMLRAGLDDNIHLRYALACSLGSEALRSHWQTRPELAAAVAPLLKSVVAKPPVARTAGQPAPSPEQAAFDSSKDLATVEIGTLAERMLFAPTEFSVRAGQPVKLVFKNPDLTQHNLVILLPGALEEIGLAANEMAKDPDSAKKGFLPKSDKILHATKLLEPNTSDVLRFKAPATPGVYPFVCTFPGHWVIMNGKMVVK